jgi:hypothetical protein
MIIGSLVIGNGESRKSIPLSEYLSRFESYGCNAAYRDLALDHICCYDTRMAREFLSNNTNPKTVLYTRSEQVDSLSTNTDHIVRSFPDLPYQGSLRADHPRHWGSGQFALLLAALGINKNIYIVGFDLFSKDGLTNNVYKDTKNYNGSLTEAVDPSYWIYQNSKIFDYFSKKNFFVINEKTWMTPDSWRSSNVSFLSLEDFKQTIDLKVNKSYNIN